MAVLIALMVLVGGATRLTESGLSIVEWKPVTGTLPPLNDRQWNEAFEGYKAIPQYRELNAGMTLHVENLYGENNHHIAETCYKGLARALKVAIAVDPRQAGRVPSTKGTLQG